MMKKKSIRRFIAMLLSVLIAVSIIPVNGLDAEAAAKPMLAKKSVSIVIGETSKIKVKNASTAKITYKSDKKGIVTVSKQGKVKGITSGTANITVSVKQDLERTKLYFKVTVKKPVLSKSKLSLEQGKTARLSVKNKPGTAKYTWKSNHPDIAAVNKNGVVTAKAKGTAVVQVKVKTDKKTYKSTCKVTVKDASDDKKQTCTVSFDSNGGSAVESQIIEKNAQAVAPADPVRDGYTFDGWYTAANGGEKFRFDTAIISDITLYAHWTRKNSSDDTQYTVTFDSNGGSAVESQTVGKNGQAVAPASPVRSGYTFSGWYTEATGGKRFDFHTAITSNITLYAHWAWINSSSTQNTGSSGASVSIPSVTQYKVTFDSNGGSAVDSQIVPSNGRANRPTDPVRSGYTFSGWYTAAEGGQEFRFDTAITSNITLYAHWTPEGKCTVTFDSNGGSAVDSQIVSKNGRANRPTDPVRSGYTFSGWYTAAEGGQEFQFDTAITSNITLYAHWTLDGQYTVTFDSNGGSAVEPQTIAAGNTATEPEPPVRDGHTFVSWYTEKNYNDKNRSAYFNFSSTPINSNITLIACWINTSDKTDTDQDGITDAIEEYIGTDKTKADTDGDGLSDYIEVAVLGLDPCKVDTDGNGINDGDEDSDADGLTNIEEISLGTDPMKTDTDGDGLSDTERSTYGTDPLNADTDGDGVSDGKEIELGTDPLQGEGRFTVRKTDDNEIQDSVEPLVEIELSGEQVETLRVDRVNNSTLFPETMPGYMGGAYDFSVNGSFDSAKIQFTFDPNLVQNQDDKLVIHYFNSEKQSFEPLETEINGNVASTTVDHFSTYILLNRTVFEETLSWQDVWGSSENHHSNLEIVLLIDDSGSMSSSDPSNLRLTVAGTLIDNLPKNSRIGIAEFEARTTTWTPLTADRDVAKSYLTTAYFQSNGSSTYMFGGIEQSLELFESTDDTTMRMLVVLSDGIAHDTSKQNDVIVKANEKKANVYTIGLGSNNTSYFNSYLKPLATDTNGQFYLAEKAEELVDVYRDIGDKIDIETDSDNDKIPDYYEDNLVMFNGVKINTDKNNPDTDGDGILDGDEVVLEYIYNQDRTQVNVYARMVSNPTKQDSDDDGFTDTEDITPLKAECFKDFDTYKNNKYGDKTVLSIFVEQPYENSRQVFYLGSDDKKSEFDVGHTFVGIDYAQNSNKEPEYAGFWPSVDIDLGHVLFNQSVDGRIQMINKAYLTKGNGQANEDMTYDCNEKEQNWNIAYVYEISDDKAGALEEYAKNYTYQYNIVSNNCTTFAVNVLKHIGISPEIYEHNWTDTGGFKEILYSKVGYTPADAGEDIRSNYYDYICKKPTALKDGTVVDAIYPNK